MRLRWDARALLLGTLATVVIANWSDGDWVRVALFAPLFVLGLGRELRHGL